MGGLLLGPAIGGLGAAIFGGVGFIFVFGAISSFLAAAAIAIRVRERPHEAGRIGPLGHGELGPEPDHLVARRSAATEAIAGAPPAPVADEPRRCQPLADRGDPLHGRRQLRVRDVRGDLVDLPRAAGRGLELIGLTFAMFGLPILVLSPFFGRRVDRGSLHAVPRRRDGPAGLRGAGLHGDRDPLCRCR
jgi:MFS family permease